MDRAIGQAKKMIESVRPIHGREGGAFQYGTHGITNRLMGTFSGPILVRGISPGQLYVIAMPDENVVDGSAFTEFAALIKMDVFVVTVGAEGREPVVEVLDRGALDLKALPKRRPLKWSEMIT